jgi:hypothetical protein
MNELKIGSTVRLKAGQGHTFVVAAFYSNGILTATPSEFVVLIESRNYAAPQITLHHSFLQLVILEEASGPSVH